MSSLRESLVNSCVAFCVCFVSRLPCTLTVACSNFVSAFIASTPIFQRGCRTFMQRLGPGTRRFQSIVVSVTHMVFNPSSFPTHVLRIKKNRRTRFSKNGTRLIQLELHVHVRVLLQRENIPTLPIDKLHFLGGAKDAILMRPPKIDFNAFFCKR